MDQILKIAESEPLKLKIKDIVEWTQTTKVSIIARDFLPVSEKPLRDILKSCGCTPQRGKSGWIYDADNPEVEKVLGDFVSKGKTRKSNSNNASNGNSKGNSNDNNASNENSDNDNKDNVINNSDNDNNGDSINNNASNSKKDDKTVSEIKALIQGKKKDDNARIYKGIYFDRDISDFLDNVQHGNKSEIVNKILRQYLMDNELM